MAYRRKDGWYRKAKQEGYRSRAAYKLEELDRRLALFRRGMRVADLGCAPGGWLQLAAARVGRRGRVVGIDRLEVAPLGLAQVEVLRGDIEDEQTAARLGRALGGPAGVVLSDMAPDTSGVGFADHARSVELVRAAASLAQALLVPGGRLVAKAFEGPDMNSLVTELGTGFTKVRRMRLKTTRKGSRELYLVAELGAGEAGPTGGHGKD